MDSAAQSGDDSLLFATPGLPVKELIIIWKENRDLILRLGH